MADPTVSGNATEYQKLARSVAELQEQVSGRVRVGGWVRVVCWVGGFGLEWRRFSECAGLARVEGCQRALPRRPAGSTLAAHAAPPPHPPRHPGAPLTLPPCPPRNDLVTHRWRVTNSTVMWSASWQRQRSC